MTDKQAKRLKIGCEVLVSATTEMLYVPEYADTPPAVNDADWLGSRKVKRETRTPVKTSLASPLCAVVTGAKHAPIGEYCPASGGGGWSGQDEEYDPPSLSQTGTVLLIRVRTRLFGRDTWAQVEDLELVEPAGGASGI